jgi:hypothetical protein
LGEWYIVYIFKMAPTTLESRTAAVTPIWLRLQLLMLLLSLAPVVTPIVLVNYGVDVPALTVLRDRVVAIIWLRIRSDDIPGVNNAG